MTDDTPLTADERLGFMAQCAQDMSSDFSKLTQSLIADIGVYRDALKPFASIKVPTTATNDTFCNDNVTVGMLQAAKAALAITASKKT